MMQEIIAKVIVLRIRLFEGKVLHGNKLRVLLIYCNGASNRTDLSAHKLSSVLCLLACLFAPRMVCARIPCKAVNLPCMRLATGLLEIDLSDN